MSATTYGDFESAAVSDKWTKFEAGNEDLTAVTQNNRIQGSHSFEAHSPNNTGTGHLYSDKTFSTDGDYNVDDGDGGSAERQGGGDGQPRMAATVTYSQVRHDN